MATQWSLGELDDLEARRRQARPERGRVASTLVSPQPMAADGARHSWTADRDCSGNPRHRRAVHRAAQPTAFVGFPARVAEQRVSPRHEQPGPGRAVEDDLRRQVSMAVAFSATFLGVALGTLLGIFSGYFGGWVDLVTQRLMEVLAYAGIDAGADRGGRTLGRPHEGGWNIILLAWQLRSLSIAICLGFIFGVMRVIRSGMLKTACHTSKRR